MQINLFSSQFVLKQDFEKKQKIERKIELTKKKKGEKRIRI